MMLKELILEAEEKLQPARPRLEGGGGVLGPHGEHRGGYTAPQDRVISR